MSPGTATLAVGNPSDRPRSSPRSTTPRTAWLRPSSRAASATSPAATASRMSVDALDLDPRGPARRLEQRQVAPAAVAEVEVLADHDRLGGEVAHELVDEDGGVFERPRLVEARDEDHVDAEPPHAI